MNDKINQNNENDIESLFDSLSLEEELKNNKGSFWEKTKYNLFNFNAAKKEFFAKTPLLSYSIKRVLYAFITLYLSLAVVYMLLVITMPESALIPDYIPEKNPIKPGTPEYYQWLDNIRDALGIRGSFLKQILLFWRNITPFIPKQVFIPYEINEVQAYGDWESKLFYVGFVLNKSNGQRYENVMDSFHDAIPVSFMLGSMALIASYVIGVPLGIIAAKNKEKPIDSGINGLFLGISSIPATVTISLFWMASIKFFGSMGLWGEDSYSNMFAVIGVMFLMMPVIVVNTRRFVIDEMTSDYTKFAMSKGLSSGYIFYVHIFRNAGIRVLKTFPETFIMCLFGSSILVETFWGVPGMSKYILSGVRTNDIFVVLGYIYISAVAGVFANLISDLLMAVLDPRIKLQAK